LYYFQRFSKVLLDFARFSWISKDSAQPACRDDELKVDFYRFSSSFPWIFYDSVGFCKIFMDFQIFKWIL
jgi:hypothetical protein